MYKMVKDNTIPKDEVFTEDSTYGDSFVKAVVDVEQEIIAYDAEMHFDLEQWLIDNGSKQQDLWGINFKKTESGEMEIQFDSMINLRPSQGNRSRSVDSLEVQEKIRTIVNRLIQ